MCWGKKKKKRFSAYFFPRSWTALIWVFPTFFHLLSFLASCSPLPLLFFIVSLVNMCLLRLDVDSTIPIYFIKPTIKAVSHFNSSSIWKNIEPLLIYKCRKKKKKKNVQYLLQRKKCQLDMATWTNFVSRGIFYKIPFLYCFHLLLLSLASFLSSLVFPFCCYFLPHFSFLLLLFFPLFYWKILCL